jgi:hypothetical protein
MARKLKTEDYTLTYGVPEYREMVELYDFAEAVHAWVLGSASTGEQDILNKRTNIYQEINMLYDITDMEEVMKVATPKQPLGIAEEQAGGRPAKARKMMTTTGTDASAGVSSSSTRQQPISPVDEAVPPHGSRSESRS